MKRRDLCERESCFALSHVSMDKASPTICTILHDTDFKGKQCPFYKTEEQYVGDRLQAALYTH